MIYWYNICIIHYKLTAALNLKPRLRIQLNMIHTPSLQAWPIYAYFKDQTLYCQTELHRSIREPENCCHFKLKLVVTLCRDNWERDWKRGHVRNTLHIAILLMPSLLYLISPAHSLSRSLNSNTRLTEYYIRSVSIYIILFCIAITSSKIFFDILWPVFNTQRKHLIYGPFFPLVIKQLYLERIDIDTGCGRVVMLCIGIRKVVSKWRFACGRRISHYYGSSVSLPASDFWYIVWPLLLFHSILHK